MSYMVLLSIAVSGCAMFEREAEEPDNSPPFPPSNFEADAFLNGADSANKGTTVQTTPATPQSQGTANEQEIAQLNSKIEALETKIEVMREEMRQMQIRGNQPKLVAETQEKTPPVEQMVDHTNIASAAPRAPKVLPTSKQAPSLVEKDFREAMRMMRAGENRESANLFFNIAKQNPRHILASHALFWAGEAGARSRNWKVSIRHWTKIEREYPRSNYMPEVLAGLSRAHAATGNLAEAKRYRTVLVQAFPDAPATLNFMSAGSGPDEKGQ